MPDQTSRRRFVAALATGSAVSTTGCASLVNAADGARASKRPETTTDSHSPPPDTTPTERRTDQSPSSPTDTGWSADDVEITRPELSFGSVAVPDDTASPTMGEATATVTVYGNWKCPYTREFVLTQLPGLADDFVRPGDVSVRFRALAYRGGDPFLGADAPQSARAGLAVWETDPEAFWTYFATVFVNQPQERYEWGTPDLLARFAAAAGVDDPTAVRRAAAGEAYESRLRQTVASATEHGIWSVPRVEYDGAVTAPTLDPANTREQFETAAEH
ncbi:DsbA family protein [Haloarcula onubensis]|uniref:Thioredoxin domain-containing protein n=1 Tax=Haloarcula onubensis TaxID=2950539 RepID=A0ABU2FPF9_9EURY|nr:thioredoxin domain-containing protein [Halomicroarcula sp. S3CR25-11]MDS0282640.1 thioredoxin domain-containing protein [Halomicroarcula sp. S3CR25-11]